ncbi:MAG: sugar phosphate nucleotidyltransferase [bacterium]|nr:sugar phosphate nucleotidyltransferase [bacterium]
MKVIIPAAGIGKRLQPLTFFLPKPLFYVGSKRIIDYVLSSLRDVDIDEYIIIVGYKKEILIDYLLKNYPDKRFTFVVQEEQSGLGDAVFKGLLNIRNLDVPLLILLSDTIIELNVEKFLKTKNSKLALMEVDDPKRFGIARIDGKFITDVVEKPKNFVSNKAIVGFYHFKSSKKLFESLNYLYENDIKTKGEIQLTDAIKKLIVDGEKIEFGEVKRWIDCGNFKTLLVANSLLLKLEKRKNFIDKTVSLENSNVIKNSSIFKNVKISGCKIKNSIIGNDVILKDCNIKDSIIGDNSSVKNFKGSIVCGENTIIKK